MSRVTNSIVAGSDAKVRPPKPVIPYAPIERLSEETQAQYNIRRVESILIAQGYSPNILKDSGHPEAGRFISLTPPTEKAALLDVSIDSNSIGVSLSEMMLEALPDSGEEEIEALEKDDRGTIYRIGVLFEFIPNERTERPPVENIFKDFFKEKPLLVATTGWTGSQASTEEMPIFETFVYGPDDMVFHVVAEYLIQLFESLKEYGYEVSNG